MREALQHIEGVRSTFRGTVDRFGTKPAYRGAAIPTIMLRDVTDKTGKVVTDHLWMVVGKQLQALHLQIGEVVEFDARVTEYEKGYKGHRDDVYDAPIETDYRLSNPTKVHRVNDMETLIVKDVRRLLGMPPVEGSHE